MKNVFRVNGFLGPVYTEIIFVKRRSVECEKARSHFFFVFKLNQPNLMRKGSYFTRW